MGSDLLVWADVETTGLNPWTGDQLLEIAVFITDPWLNMLDEDGYHAVIANGPSVRSLANEYVQKMHDETGLWEKVMHPSAKTLRRVDEELSSYIKRYAPESQSARMAGNSVRLDLAFTDRYLPQTAAHLHYRILDVSSIAFEGYNFHGFAPYEKKLLHTAESDIRESIEELKYLRHRLYDNY